MLKSFRLTTAAFILSAAFVLSATLGGTVAAQTGASPLTPREQWLSDYLQGLASGQSRNGPDDRTYLNSNFDPGERAQINAFERSIAVASSGTVDQVLIDQLAGSLRRSLPAPPAPPRITFSDDDGSQTGDRAGGNDERDLSIDIPAPGGDDPDNPDFEAWTEALAALPEDKRNEVQQTLAAIGSIVQADIGPLMQQINAIISTQSIDPAAFSNLNEAIATYAEDGGASERLRGLLTTLAQDMPGAGIPQFAENLLLFDQMVTSETDGQYDFLAFVVGIQTLAQVDFDDVSNINDANLAQIATPGFRRSLRVLVRQIPEYAEAAAALAALTLRVDDEFAVPKYIAFGQAMEAFNDAMSENQQRDNGSGIDPNMLAQMAALETQYNDDREAILAVARRLVANGDAPEDWVDEIDWINTLLSQGPRGKSLIRTVVDASAAWEVGPHADFRERNLEDYIAGQIREWMETSPEDAAWIAELVVNPDENQLFVGYDENELFFGDDDDGVRMPNAAFRRRLRQSLPHLASTPSVRAQLTFDGVLQEDAGRDIIAGGGGSDTVQEGSDRDSVFGGGGSDTVLGDAGPGAVFNENTTQTNIAEQAAATNPLEVAILDALAAGDDRVYQSLLNLGGVDGGLVLSLDARTGRVIGRGTVALGDGSPTSANYELAFAGVVDVDNSLITGQLIGGSTIREDGANFPLEQDMAPIARLIELPLAVFFDEETTFQTEFDLLQANNPVPLGSETVMSAATVLLEFQPEPLNDGNAELAGFYGAFLFDRETGAVVDGNGTELVVDDLITLTATANTLDINRAAFSLTFALAVEYLNARFINPDPGATDTDGDGVSDAIEDLIDGDPGTADIDTDGDGLLDIEEEVLFLNPNDADSDADGTGDFAEASSGVFEVPAPTFTDREISTAILGDRTFVQTFIRDIDPAGPPGQPTDTVLGYISGEPAPGFSYLGWGETAYDIGTEDDDMGMSVERLGYVSAPFVFGTELTDFAALPATGVLATYDGDIRAIGIADGGRFVFDVGGEVVLEVAFGPNTVNGGFTLAPEADGAPDEIALDVLNGVFDATGIRFGLEASLNGAPEEVGAGFGAFFGPNGEEIGGVFDATFATEGINIGGGFVAGSDDINGGN